MLINCKTHGNITGTLIGENKYVCCECLKIMITGFQEDDCSYCEDPGVGLEVHTMICDKDRKSS